MSALEKDITYLLIASLKENDEPDKAYIILGKTLSARTGRRVSAKAILEATSRLRKCSYIIEDGDTEIGATLLTGAKYDPETDQVKLKISRRLHPLFFDLQKNFTEFGLLTALSLRSKYSKRMYEMLCQHKHEGILKISIDTLRLRLQLLDPKNKIDKLQNWSIFEKTVLKVSQQEINSKTDIRFSYTVSPEPGRGKKYRNIEFKIFWNTEQLSLKI